MRRPTRRALERRMLTLDDEHVTGHGLGVLRRGKNGHRVGGTIICELIRYFFPAWLT